MDIILISPPDVFRDEIKLIHKMFKAGLGLFHLRKPQFSSRQVSEYLKAIDKDYHHRIVIHSHYDLINEYDLRGIHITETYKNVGCDTSSIYKIYNRPEKKTGVSISFHRLEELSDKNPGFTYGFLSPVFDSISKKGYKSDFDFNKVKKVLTDSDFKIFALGGCQADKLNILKHLGFYGAAFLGAVWNQQDPFNCFEFIKASAGKIK